MLVALSNPRGVASLLDVAAHATEPETPAPRVLALVRGHRAESDRDFARRTRRCPRPRRFCSRQWIMRAVSVRKSKRCRDGPTIPARDIIQSALDISAGWILIGFHKPAFGTDGMGGTVRAVLERARTMPIHVGVVTRGEPGRIDRIFALVDNTTDGRAALDLGSRIARKYRLSLRALLMPQDGGQPEPALKNLLRDASRTAGKWLYTDVLHDRSACNVIGQTPGKLVIVGKRR